ncbi:MAG: phosphoribosylformylglycinamidine synthase [Epulopiscium sp. Nele67-Bin001]|nr:MAG: phosphoribosylformylglycinamidine synthase [Epulopiscium sp. Nele67-Bin001]
MYRLYVEKKPGFDVGSNNIKNEIREFLHINGVENVRIFNRYDVENISEEVFHKAKTTIFSEPQSDNIYEEFLPELHGSVFVTQFLNGQYDQMSDSCEQCIRLIDENSMPIVKIGTVFCIEGNISPQDIKRIQQHLINPIEKELVTLDKPTSLFTEHPIAEAIETIDDFTLLSEAQLKDLKKEFGLAMNIDDLLFFKDYFKSENRNPTFTELRVVDTYWSDHCRHTTFMTELLDINIEEGPYSKPLVDALQAYQQLRLETGNDKKSSLMDLATIIMKSLRRQGKLQHLVESDENNACTIEDIVYIDGRRYEYLILFKNETHNHPTEIEPFGGAATCLGGAIRDPLSGRAYVYQAMRITGAADPNEKVEDTLKGKLSQRQITQTAANGFSSYGNQIGLATGEVKEYYHPGYKAKRLEVGAVVGAVPKYQVKREQPTEGDVILLIGGATGRDGCGGATGSSKEHTTESIKMCGSEVQKGNPVEERKLQRLFRNPSFTSKIKRCNDFGAGGVCVAIGEIARGLVIELDQVPLKYTGLDGTEIAISESQERMAIAISRDDMKSIIKLCKKENLNAVHVATVTNNNRLLMTWRGQTIVDISRDFLDSAGILQTTDAYITSPKLEMVAKEDVTLEQVKACLKKLNNSLQKGLSSQFDSTVGAGTVLLPYGGKYQLTKELGMVAKIPVIEGDTNSATYMTHGFDPELMEKSPFHGAVYAVVESVAKQVALGADYNKIYLSFQEYFERLGKDPNKWGKPVAALLGAFEAQRSLEIGAIGGKDSMSGTFEDLTVPPTFISFACSVGFASNCTSGSFKRPHHKILHLHIPIDEYGMPDFKFMKETYQLLHYYIYAGYIKSTYTIGCGGIMMAIAQMSLGNKIGARIRTPYNILNAYYGDILISVSPEYLCKIDADKFIAIGDTLQEEVIEINDISIGIDEVLEDIDSTLRNVFSYNADTKLASREVHYTVPQKAYICKNRVAKPKVVIPVFPGTNCEYDTQKAFLNAGAEVEQVVFLNRTSDQIVESIARLEKAIQQANIIAFPGGFSAGDEPDGSGKFIATTFRNQRLKHALHNYLDTKDGLIIGICNGFQVLVKLGLLPEGRITERTEGSPTLTFNTLGKHISTMANTEIVSTKSAWLRYVNVGERYRIPISHGEGRFVASQETIDSLIHHGQIFSQYVNENGIVTAQANVNGSMYNIEGIVSRDGRILGKMGHNERVGANIHINVPGNKDQRIFRAGVDYFKDTESSQLPPVNRSGNSKKLG